VKSAESAQLFELAGLRAFMPQGLDKITSSSTKRNGLMTRSSAGITLD
jgi:hypothetical protein